MVEYRCCCRPPKYCLQITRPASHLVGSSHVVGGVRLLALTDIDSHVVFLSERSQQLTRSPGTRRRTNVLRGAREATQTMHCFLPFLSPLLPSVAFICLHPVSRLCLQRVYSSFTTFLLSQSNICHFSDNGQRGAHRLRGGGPSYHHWS